MRLAARIAGFAAALVAIFAAAAIAGAEIDPSVEEPAPHDADEEMDTHASETDGHANPAEGGALPGLAVADGGYRLVPERTLLAAAPSATYRFKITGPDGETVREFDREHERRMHLIVVRRDFTGFQHLHPRQLPDGTWKVELDANAAGAHRVFADFSTGGRSLTLGTDLFVPGPFEPQPLPAPSDHAHAGDGYEVELGSDGGELAFTVTRDGRPVDRLEPYLGADGHLVALREHDQAFLHTHPEGEAGGGGPIRFQVEYPTAGRYRLYLQFRHDGEVRTAEFTQRVGRDGVARGGHGHEENGDGGH